MNILKEIKTSLIVTLVMLVICCAILSVGYIRGGSTALPETGQRQPGAGTTRESRLPPRCWRRISPPTNTSTRVLPPRGANGYDSTSSAGSNYGATSQALRDAVKQRVADYRKANNLPDTQPVPADAVEASGSGLDPHISLKKRGAAAPARGQGPQPERGRSQGPGREIYGWPRLRHPGRAGRQHRQTQFGFGRKIQMTV